MGNKALIITGKLVQDHEFIYPYYRLKEEGYEVVLSLDNQEPTVGILGTKIPSDVECKIISYEDLTKINPEDYELLIIPGGAKCMEYIRQKENVINFIKDFKGRIGCICHGAQLLISAKRTKGKKISAYYSLKDDVINSGAEYVDTLVEDDNIVTCPHYKELGKWMKKILKKE